MSRTQRWTGEVRKEEGDYWANKFVAFIGSGENTLGRFPVNLSELSAALHECVTKSTQRPPRKKDN